MDESFLGFLLNLIENNIVFANMIKCPDFMKKIVNLQSFVYFS